MYLRSSVSTVPVVSSHRVEPSTRTAGCSDASPVVVGGERDLLEESTHLVRFEPRTQHQNP